MLLSSEAEGPFLKSFDPQFLEPPTRPLPTLAPSVEPAPAVPPTDGTHSVGVLTAPFPRITGKEWGDFFAHVVVEVETGLFRLRLRHREMGESFLSASLASTFQDSQQLDTALRGGLAGCYLHSVVKRKIEGVRFLLVRMRLKTGDPSRPFTHTFPCSHHPEPLPVVLRRQIVALRKLVRRQGTQLAQLQAAHIKLLEELREKSVISAHSEPVFEPEPAEPETPASPYPESGMQYSYPQPAEAATAVVAAPVVEEVVEEEEEDGEMSLLFVCRGKFEYVARSESQISCQVSEVLKVLHKSEGGWWYCKNQRGETGYLPGNFTDAWE